MSQVHVAQAGRRAGQRRASAPRHADVLGRVLRLHAAAEQPVVEIGQQEIAQGQIGGLGFEGQTFQDQGHGGVIIPAVVELDPGQIEIGQPEIGIKGLGLVQIGQLVLVPSQLPVDAGQIETGPEVARRNLHFL